jgi:hypothetical protein
MQKPFKTASPQCAHAPASHQINLPCAIPHSHLPISIQCTCAYSQTSRRSPPHVLLIRIHSQTTAVAGRRYHPGLLVYLSSLIRSVLLVSLLVFVALWCIPACYIIASSSRTDGALCSPFRYSSPSEERDSSVSSHSSEPSSLSSVLGSSSSWTRPPHQPRIHPSRYEAGSRPVGWQRPPVVLVQLGGSALLGHTAPARRQDVLQFVSP